MGYQPESARVFAGNNKREKRLAFIVQSVATRHFVSLREIAEAFGVNMQTARRDVAYLDELHVITKTHGGAVSREEPDALSVSERLNIHEDDKQRIARTAATFVNDGDIIYLDGASTIAYMAPYLLQKQLQVVTNFMSVANELKSGWPNIEVTVTGGYYFPRSEILLGPPALETIRHLHIDKVFMGAAGLTEDGIYNANMLVVELEQTVIAQATATYLLVDDTKFGRPSLMPICGFDRINTIFTNKPASPSIEQAITAAGCAIHVCTADQE
ncbi:MAG TPA: DeoR/GlpR family DNA-binding transcription regulator [Armatimonadota bacterium]|nr:DeoR/GlpR family DNA-binding transcription regulator [Armatimonadota bacterium]